MNYTKIIILCLGLFLGITHSANAAAYSFQNTEKSAGSAGDENDLNETTPAANGPGPVTLETLIRKVLDNNPGLRAKLYLAEASRTRTPQAGAWNDPKLSFNIMNVPVSEFGFDVEPMTQKQVGLMQRIPFPGISGFKEDVAEYGSDIAALNASEYKNRIIMNVSLLYYDIAYIDKAIELSQKNKNLLKSLFAAAAKKYEVGEGLQQDVLKAQVEISRISDRLISYHKRRDAVVSTLNAFLNKPPEVPLGKLQPMEFLPVELNSTQLQDSAVQSRPLLNSQQTFIQKNKSLLELARKSYWPGMDIGIAYSQRDNRRDFLSVQVSLNIPLWQNRKQDKKVAESELNVKSAEQQYNDTKNLISSRISAKVYAAEEAGERLHLLGEVIIPQAEQSLSSARSGYEVGKVDFLTLLNNQITLFNLDIDYYRLLSGYWKDIAGLEYLVGQKLQ